MAQMGPVRIRTVQKAIHPLRERNPKPSIWAGALKNIPQIPDKKTKKERSATISRGAWR